MTGHIAKKCYKLHGYPPGHKLHTRNNSKSIAATVTQSRALFDDDHEEDSTESMMLTRSQYQQLLSLLHSKETSSAMASLSVTQPSSSTSNPHVSNSRVSGMATCFSTRTHSSSHTHISPWIIDTGATDHMICCTSLFTSITTTVSYKLNFQMAKMFLLPTQVCITFSGLGCHLLLWLMHCLISILPLHFLLLPLLTLIPYVIYGIIV